MAGADVPEAWPRLRSEKSIRPQISMKTKRRRSSRAAGLRTTAGAALAAGVLLTAGCGDFIGSSTPQPTIQAVEADQPRAIDVTGGAGFLRFEGNITTTTRCQGIVAELDNFSEPNGSGGEADIAVEARAEEPCPDDQETTFNYIGNLNGIQAGTYSVTVTHRFQNQDLPSQTVFEGQLEVASR